MPQSLLPEKTKAYQAKNAPYLVWCILFISIGNQYKLLFCGFLGKVIGLDSICYTMFHGISTNHWFEHFVFVPLLWIVLNYLNNVVFSSTSSSRATSKPTKLKWLGQFLCVLFVYGHGIHITNTLEIMARDNGLANGLLYEQIWWLDEEVSHWLQFGAFFSLIALFITQDGLDRQQGAKMAVLTGILHGIDRGVGFVEGNNPFLGFALIVMIGMACWVRWQKHERDFQRVWKDFFFRHGIIFATTVLIFLVSYQLVFGLAIQPSTMGMEAWRIVALAISIILVEALLVIRLDGIK